MQLVVSMLVLVQFYMITSICKCHYIFSWYKDKTINDAIVFHNKKETNHKIFFLLLFFPISWKSRSRKKNIIYQLTVGCYLDQLIE